MKAPLNLFIFLIPFQFFAQDFNETLESVRVAEAKAALNKIFFRVNSNTGNYDLKYHRLEFNLDPSVNLFLEV